MDLLGHALLSGFESREQVEVSLDRHLVIFGRVCHAVISHLPDFLVSVTFQISTASFITFYDLLWVGCLL